MLNDEQRRQIMLEKERLRLEHDAMQADSNHTPYYPRKKSNNYFLGIHKTFFNIILFSQLLTSLLILVLSVVLGLGLSRGLQFAIVFLMFQLTSLVLQVVGYKIYWWVVTAGWVLMALALIGTILIAIVDPLVISQYVPK